MKITLDIPDGIIAGFFNGVEVTAHGMQLVSYQLSTDDLKGCCQHRQRWSALVRLSGKARLLCSLREANQRERLVW